MRVAAEVIGRPLVLPGGARYNVGERIMLDPNDEQHREVIDNGWVRRLDESTLARAVAPSAPPAHKMVAEPQQKKAHPKQQRGRS